MITLWLIRHGETDWNVQRLFQGISDQVLNERGEQQATCLIPRLENMSFDAIYSSDLKRVQRTAQLALNGKSDGIILDPRLREIDFGQWEGLSWDQARELDPETFDLWLNNRELNPHGGERMSDIVTRIELFLNDIQAQHNEDEQILIFAHGGTLATLICILLGSDPNRWWQYRILNCTLNEVLLMKRGAILARLNDGAHLTD